MSMRRTTDTLSSLIVILCSVLFTTKVAAQKVEFCEQVTQQGECIHAGSFFRVTDKGGRLQVVVHSAAPLAGDKAVLDLFFKDDSGKEKFESTIKVDVQPDWMWFSRQLVFQRPGEYVVYAYDSKGNLIGTASLTIGRAADKQ
ncbi:MAG: hypothetical protein ACKO1U_09170 [Bacteroidota bacterium]